MDGGRPIFFRAKYFFTALLNKKCQNRQLKETFTFTADFESLVSCIKRQKGQELKRDEDMFYCSV